MQGGYDMCKRLFAKLMVICVLVASQIILCNGTAYQSAYQYRLSDKGAGRY